MVPHSIVTVSLATAMLPRLSSHAAAGDRTALAGSLASTLRAALAVIVPFVALLPVIAPDLARLAWPRRRGRGRRRRLRPDALAVRPRHPVLHVPLLVLRGYYALELNRTVFFVQCGVAATNIVAAIALVAATSAEHTSPALVVAYAASYVVGSVVSYLLLRTGSAGCAAAGC